MNDRDFQTKLGELMAMIETAPETDRERLRELADETKIVMSGCARPSRNSRSPSTTCV